MGFRLSVLICVFAIPGACLAQTVQIYGGYSRVGSKAPVSNGWNVSMAVNVYKSLDLVADFAGGYSSRQYSDPTYSSDSSSRRYALLFGPRLSYRRYERLTPFIHVLAGLERDSSRGSETFLSTGYNYKVAQNALCVAVGAGLDVGVNRRIAVRVIQFDGLGLEAGGWWGADYRFSSGLVLRF